LIHRIAASKRYSSSLIEIQSQWSLDDVMDAIKMLDMYDELDAIARAPAGQELLT